MQEWWDLLSCYPAIKKAYQAKVTTKNINKEQLVNMLEASGRDGAPARRYFSRIGVRNIKRLNDSIYAVDILANTDVAQMSGEFANIKMYVLPSFDRMSPVPSVVLNGKSKSAVTEMIVMFEQSAETPDEELKTKRQVFDAMFEVANIYDPLVIQYRSDATMSNVNNRSLVVTGLLGDLYGHSGKAIAVRGIDRCLVDLHE